MRKVSTSFAVFVLLTQVVGCADTPEVLVHDWLVFWNEVGDYQLQAINEATAGELLEKDTGKYKMLKARFDAIKERQDKKVLRDMDKDKEMQLNLRNAELDYYEETVATAKRLHSVHKRMNDIILAILKEDQDRREKEAPEKGRPAPNWSLVGNLIKVRNWTNEWLQATPNFKAPGSDKQGGMPGPGGGGGGGGPGGGGGNAANPEGEFSITNLKPNPIFWGDDYKLGGTTYKWKDLGMKWGDGLLPEMYEYKKKREDDAKKQQQLQQKGGGALMQLPAAVRGAELAVLTAPLRVAPLPENHHEYRHC
jgi:hypothetical protein